MKSAPAEVKAVAEKMGRARVNVASIFLVTRFQLAEGLRQHEIAEPDDGVEWCT